MMTDQELLLWNEQGFFPGPEETESDFLARIHRVKEAVKNLGDAALPFHHWDWVRVHLREVYDFVPECLPAFYSNQQLMPWQGAATWIDEGKIGAIQLREALRQGHYLRIYRREEILIHEVVHAARAAFQENRFEEFFAYATAESRWRRATGPIVQRPWEVWPFVLSCLIGSVYPVAFLGASLWALLGFIRLIRGHLVLQKAGARLTKIVGSMRIARAILVRLKDQEIEKIAKGIPVGDDSLRWRLLRLAYWREINGTKNCC